MSSNELKARLLQAIDSGSVFAGTEEVIEALETSGGGLDAVRTILVFMEDHGSVDFGAPGPLVHFVERFYKNGYEALLLESVRRRPTGHTLWMLNRVLNGTKLPAERHPMIETLKLAVEHDQADEVTRKEATHFLSLHT